MGSKNFIYPNAAKTLNLSRGIPRHGVRSKVRESNSSPIITRT